MKRFIKKTEIDVKTVTTLIKKYITKTRSLELIISP